MKTKLLLSLLASSAALMAAEPSADRPAPFSDRLTGDWGGERTRLADLGVNGFAYNNAIIASNVSGGIRNEADYAGDIFFGAEVIVLQAVEQFVLYTGVRPDAEWIDRAAAFARRPA